MDWTQLINQGVTADRVVTDRRGIRVREITFCNPCDGEVYKEVRPPAGSGAWQKRNEGK
jgi:hypothetical protein